MRDEPTVIANPVINSPFEAPGRHSRFDDEGITDEIVPTRSSDAHFIPIPPKKNRGKQPDRSVQENDTPIQ